MKILDLLRQKKYFLIFSAATAGMLIVYPLLQSFGNVDIWFQVIELDNLILYISFSVLFGILIMLQAAKLTNRTCRIKSGGAGAVGTFGGFLIAQCPSCAILLSLFLPFNVILFIVTYNTWLTLGSITLMLLAIHFLGGFRSDRQKPS